jgi:ribosome-associated protein
MKTSHERVLERPGPRPKTKRTRGAPRSAASAAAAASAAGGPRLRKTRGGASVPPPASGEQPDRSGSWSVASDRARETAVSIAIAALDKKAAGLEILDVAGKVDYADFLVIMTGRSDRHAQALAQGIEEALKKRGVRPLAVEGLPHASWVLMDFGDVVVHVFLDDARSLYDIEGLWLDARRLPVPVPAQS